MDSNYVKAHQHNARAATHDQEAIGLLAVDGYGLPIVFAITGGELHKAKAAPDLLSQVSIDAILINI